MIGDRKRGPQLMVQLSLELLPGSSLKLEMYQSAAFAGYAVYHIHYLTIQREEGGRGCMSMESKTIRKPMHWQTYLIPATLEAYRHFEDEPFYPSPQLIPLCLLQFPEFSTKCNDYNPSRVGTGVIKPSGIRHRITYEYRQMIIFYVF